MTDRTINPGGTQHLPRKDQPEQDHPLLDAHAAMDDYVKLAAKFEATNNVANAQQMYLNRIFAELGNLYQEALNELDEMQRKLEAVMFAVPDSEIRHGEKLVLKSQAEQLPLPVPTPADAVDDEESFYEGMPEHMRHSDSARRGWKAGAKAAGWKPEKYDEDRTVKADGEQK